MNTEIYLIISLIVIILMTGFLYYFWLIIKKYKNEINKLNELYNDIELRCNLLNDENQWLHNEVNTYYKQCRLLEEIEDDFEENLGENQFVRYKEKYKGKKALIGDYIEESAKLTRNVLRDFGFQVDIVTKGADLINRMLYGKKSYDIIFTNNTYKDKYLNENVCGLTVVQTLKSQENFNTPIVVHTVSDESEDSFIKKGFDGYIKKTVKHTDLQKLLNKIMK